MRRKGRCDMLMPPPPPDFHEGDVIKKEEILTEEMLELKFLNGSNASFKATKGGFASLAFEGREYKRVNFRRAFPFSSPDSFISVRECGGKEREIGMIKNLSDFDGETVDLIKKQLDIGYFMPKIIGITKVKEEYGYSYWDVTTDRGGCRFTADSNGVVKLSPTRLIISDVDGNRFELPDVTKLSAKELRMIDLYI